MPDLYTVKQASEVSGISKPALRVYSQRYARWLSTEATPVKGQARTFTADDLRLLRFVYDQTNAGANHEQVIERLEAGELANYAWSVEDAEDADETALMPPDMVRMTQALLEEARSREQAALDRERQLIERIENLQRELGETKGRLEELRDNRYHAPKWFKSVFGGRRD